MALAYISFAGENNGKGEFYADIGSNKFYRYRIGGSRTNVNGLTLIEDVTYNSEMFEHNSFNPFSTRFMIKIPMSLFKKSREYVQLFSYSEKNGISPAVSDITEVNPQADILNNEWPLLSAQSKQMSMYPENNHTENFNPCRTVSFSFQESQLSNTMFLDTLLQAAKVLAPTAIQAIGSLLKSGGGSGTGAVSGSANTSSSSDSIMKIISAIVETLANQPKNTTTPVPDNSKSLSQINPYSNSFSFTKIKNIGRKGLNTNGFAKQQIIDGGVLTGPLLMAVLGPLLQQAPQLLQAIGDTPVKWLNAINEGDLKQKQQDQAHIQNLLAISEQNDLLKLLASTSKSDQQNQPTSMSYSVNNSISISFEAGQTITVNGKQKSVYITGSPVKLLLHISTTTAPPKRPIPKALIQLQVKDALTKKLLLEKKYRLTDVFLNSMQELEILPNEMEKLPVNTDLLVSASFVWPSKSSGKKEGKSNVHAIFLVNEYLLKHFGNKSGNDIPLTDMNKYRVFWNKIWEGSSGSKRRWQTSMDAKYYTYFQPKAISNGRIETKIKINSEDKDESNSRQITVGKLKSGLEVSPVELNKLIPEISSYPVLTQNQLLALQSDDLQKRFNQEARANLNLRGKKDETGVIWAYPEVALHKVVLSRVVKTDGKGQVTEMKDEELYFPGLTSIHFAGVKTI